MNTKLFIFFCCSVFIVFITAEKSIQESFTVPARPKKESHNTINEATGKLILTNNRKCAQLIKYIAEIEELLIDHGDLLLGQKKNSFFVDADTNRLQEYRTTQQELTSSLDSCHKLLQQVKIKLKDLASSQ